MSAFEEPIPHVENSPLPDPPYDGETPKNTPLPTDGALALDFRPLVWGPPGATPDERKLRHFGQALAEVLAGRRPPASIADRLSDRAYKELLKAGRMIESTRPPFAGLPHVTEPRDGAVEMCLLVHCGERSHVLAARLERLGMQWLCTDFETA
jgi:hypothetical protein